MFLGCRLAGVAVKCYRGKVSVEKTLALETGAIMSAEDADIVFNIQHEDFFGNVGYLNISGSRSLSSENHTVTNVQRYTLDKTIRDNDDNIIATIYQPNLFGFEVDDPEEPKEFYVVLQL